MRAKRRYLIYLPIVLVVTGVLIGAGLYFGGNTPTDSPEHIVAARFTRPNLVSYNQGMRSWSLQAEAVEEMPGGRDQVVRLIDITEGIVYKEGEPNIYFSADEGTWRKSNDDLLFYGNVLVTQGDQWFSADSLKADMTTEEMHFVGNVVWENDAGTQIVANEAVYRSVDDSVEFRGAEDPVILTRQE